MQTNDDDVTHATVKQSKRKANTKDFQTKPIPEKKRKKEVDANEIIKTHTKKGVEDYEEETQQKTTQISKKTDRKAYATQSKVNLECHEDPPNTIADKSEEMTKEGKKSKSIEMTLENKERKKRKASETSDDNVQSSTSKSKDINQAKNKRRK